MVDAPRRLPLFALLAVLLVAVAVGGSAASAPRPDASSADRALAAVQARRDVRSAAWYCPLASASTRTDPTDSVTVSNVGDRAVKVEFTALAAGKVVARDVSTAPARSTSTILVSSLTRLGQAALIVEPFGPGVAVAHTTHVDRDLAVDSCATRTASTWYFAAGSTVPGSTENVVVFNPLRRDAVLDVTLYTEDGQRQPPAWQGFAVAGRTRAALSLDELADRKHIVAVRVAARDGARVISEQALTIGSSRGRRGVALALGATAPSTRLELASGVTRDEITRRLFVLNPNDAATDIEIDVAAGPGVVIPSTTRIAAGAAVAIDVATLTRAVPRYNVVVIAPADHPVVAQVLTTYRGVGAADRLALTTTMASSSPSRSWVFARNLARGGSAASLSVVNPSRRLTHVVVTFPGGGSASAATRRRFAIAPRGRKTIELPVASGAARSAVESAVLVTATQPVIAEQLLDGLAGATQGAGVPAAR